MTDILKTTSLYFHILLLFYLTNCCSSRYIQLDLTTNNGYQWQASLPNRSLLISGNVPGSIYTDLQQAGILTQGSLFYRFNDDNYRWIAYNDWMYHLTFDVNATVFSESRQFFIFHGIDTVANISLNGEFLGFVQNMFVRYRFDVTDLLKVANNELIVAFQSPITYAGEKYQEQMVDYVVPPKCVPNEYHGECHANHIRKMQASFSWDWGPAFPTVGLWRPISLESYSTLMLRDVYVETIRNESEWQVHLKLYCETVESNSTYRGTWEIQLYDEQDILIQEIITDSSMISNEQRETVTNIQFSVTSNQINPWMPNGYGSQSLYKLNIYYSENGVRVVEKQKKIGFRTVSLMEDDLDIGGRTFYITVNDVPVFLKGSNWIPASVLPELVDEDYIRLLLTSVKDTNMNTLRVWGGGIYEFDQFYDIADEMGILIWQDFMFACSMYPVSSWFLETVSAEIRQQVRRLQPHPSVMLWAGSNENEAALRGNWYGTASNFSLYKADYIRLYVDTIRVIVQEEDPTRPFVVSSPSNGKRSEEEGHIAQNPYSDLYGDVHYYNYYANAWNWTSYPKPRMATEYGFQSLPSIHAWKEAAEPIDLQGTDWHYDGELLNNRQHHPLGNFELNLQVATRFGEPLTTDQVQHFLAMIYLTQMHQAQAIKTETEHYRRLRYHSYPDGSGLTMAALYWQLNDIWQAPSWASIEYGGRWKPLHYFAGRFFAPLSFFLMELEEGIVAALIHFDRSEDVKLGTLQVSIYSWEHLEPKTTYYVSIKEMPNPGFPVWYEILDVALVDTSCSRETCFIASSYVDEAGIALAPDNELYLSSFPRITNLQKANVLVSSVSPVYVSNKSLWTVNVTLSTDHIAAFVWIDTRSDWPGTFSDNGFLLRQPFKTIIFYSRKEIIESNDLLSELTVTHLSQMIV